MTKIQKTIDKENQITIFTVSGEFFFDQIVDVVKQFYLSEFTLNIIFDLNKADMSALTAGQMEEIVKGAKEYAHLREGGKTALIMSRDLNYGIARMFETYCEIKGHPIAYNVFKNIDEAMTWIVE